MSQVDALVPKMGSSWTLSTTLFPIGLSLHVRVHTLCDRWVYPKTDRLHQLVTGRKRCEQSINHASYHHSPSVKDRAVEKVIRSPLSFSPEDPSRHLDLYSFFLSSWIEEMYTRSCMNMHVYPVHNCLMSITLSFQPQGFITWQLSLRAFCGTGDYRPRQSLLYSVDAASCPLDSSPSSSFSFIACERYTRPRNMIVLVLDVVLVVPILTSKAHFRLQGTTKLEQS